MDLGDDVGPRQHEQIVVAAQIAADGRANRSPRKSASVSWCRWIIVPIAPSRTRIRFASSASSCRRGRQAVIGHSWSSCRSCLRAVVFGPARDQHRERIAGLARADADLDVGRARPPSASASARRRRSRGGDRRAWRGPILRWCARRSSTSTRPPGRGDRAPLRRRRAPDRCAWCSACDSIATSTDASCIGSFSSSPFFQITFDTRRRRASALARVEHDVRAIDGDRPATPSAPLRSSGSLRRSRGRRP